MSLISQYKLNTNTDTPITQDSQSIDVTDGLISNWRMNDNAANSTVTDSFGNNDGTYKDSGGAINTSTGSVAGKINNAIDFDGNDEEIVVPHDTSISFDDTQSRTISFWMKAPSTGHSSNYPRIMKKFSGSGNYYIFGNDLSSTTGIVLRIYDGSSSVDVRPTNVFDDTWHHIIQVVDRDSDLLYGYKDGTEVNSEDISGIGDTSTTADVYIGSANGNHFLNGKIDDVRIYNKALSQAEIDTIYNNGNGVEGRYGKLHNGLISQWRMNSNWNDSYGSNDGTGYGGVGFDTTTPKLGSGSGVFDGTDDYVDISDSSDFDLQVWTISAWVNANSFNGSGYNEITSQGDYIFKTRFDSRDGSNGSFRVEIQNTNNDWYHANWDVLPSTGTWYHIVGVSDSNNDLKLYVNGDLKDTTAIGSIDIRNPNAPFVIGKQGGNTSNWWDGKIDDVRIYNRALTATEISNIYNSGNGSEVAEASVAIDNSVGGKVGNAIDFDGVDEYVEVADDASIDFGDESFSVSFWVNADSWLGQAPQIYHGGWGEAGYYARNNNGNSISFYINDGTDYVNVGDSSLPPTGTWTHYVMVQDESANILYLYKDGSQIDSIDSSVVDSISIAVPLRMGWDDSMDEYFDGSLDDVRIYAKALTQAEIDFLYNGGAGTENLISLGTIFHGINV